METSLRTEFEKARKAWENARAEWLEAAKVTAHHTASAADWWAKIEEDQKGSAEAFWAEAAENAAEARETEIYLWRRAATLGEKAEAMWRELEPNR